MASKAKVFITNPDILAAFRQMIDAVPDMEWKGKTHPYMSINGNMYASVSKDHVIGIRLSKTDCETFMKEYRTGLFEPFPGFFQKGYVPIPTRMHRDIPTLQSWFVKSHAFASDLKPKPTTRKK